MNKTRKAWKAICWILRKPVLLNRVLEDEDNWQGYVERHYSLPDGLPVVDMDQVISPGARRLGPMTYLDGGSLPTDLMLLAGLAEGMEACSYFEIGTWRGESVATVAPRAQTCHTLCLSDEQMRLKGMHPDHIASHGQFSGQLGNVTQHRGDSRNFDFGQFQGKFDLIFIDGDHHYEVVLSDTIQVFRHLVHERSVVVWHDYGFHPDRVRYEVMAAILDGVGKERAPLVYHVGHTKSAIFTGKDLQSMPAGFPKVPDTWFSTEISKHPLDAFLSKGGEP
jgi:predicted O-methyltransferase YrrM